MLFFFSVVLWLPNILPKASASMHRINHKLLSLHTLNNKELEFYSGDRNTKVKIISGQYLKSALKQGQLKAKKE